MHDKHILLFMHFTLCINQCSLRFSTYSPCIRYFLRYLPFHNVDLVKGLTGQNSVDLCEIKLHLRSPQGSVNGQLIVSTYTFKTVLFTIGPYGFYVLHPRTNHKPNQNSL